MLTTEDTHTHIYSELGMEKRIRFWEKVMKMWKNPFWRELNFFLYLFSAYMIHDKHPHTNTMSGEYHASDGICLFLLKHMYIVHDIIWVLGCVTYFGFDWDFSVGKPSTCLESFAEQWHAQKSFAMKHDTIVSTLQGKLFYNIHLNLFDSLIILVSYVPATHRQVASILPKTS